MAKVEIGEEVEIDEKDPVSNEDIKSQLNRLSDKIDKLSDQMKEIEKKLNSLPISTKSSSGSEVEVEEQTELDEDYLTPADLIFENDAIRNTGLKLVSLRIATASEIANITKKDRAVESLYLNDLYSRNKVRKLRIGRKIYFYIGKSNEIKPFKNSSIKPEWRDVLISIIRGLDTFETIKPLTIQKVIKNYKECTLGDDMTKSQDSESDELFEKTVLELLKDLETNAQLVKIKDDKVEYLIHNWMQLGY